MSGGVDSSVSAALLVEQGYEVLGMMMRLWSEPGQGPSAPMNRCCTPDQMADARRVADKLKIPFYVVDIQDYFRKTIVQFFIDEHVAGRTPNPCIECNREIRFHYLLERALALDADYLATGHYARVFQTEQGYELRKAVDLTKDQSYVLHVLDQEALSHVLFPVGDYKKETVREMAIKFNLPVAQKSDSMDLCFLGDGDYRRFLNDHVPEATQAGPILTQSGEEVGRHTGLPNYTIGQRKGLGIAAAEPMFVLEKDVSRNAVIVGPRTETTRATLIARQVNWTVAERPSGPIEAQVKIRYKANAVPAVVTPITGDKVSVTFKEPVFGITAGQGAVFYDGDIVLGGGIIAQSGSVNTE